MKLLENSAEHLKKELNSSCKNLISEIKQNPYENPDVKLCQ